MSAKIIAGTLLAVSSIALIASMGFLIYDRGYADSEKIMQQQAIKAGVARWVVDNDGVASFEFLKQTIVKPYKMGT